VAVVGDSPGSNEIPTSSMVFPEFGVIRTSGTKIPRVSEEAIDSESDLSTDASG
jgi:hypothetical protein